MAHTPYETEKVFYSCIRAGDAEGVKRFFDEYLSQGIVVGSMSADPLTQMKYFAVCCITLACRYAISGGLDEKEAFNFSDECIRRVDGMRKGEEIMSFLMSRACELAERVGEKGAAADVPPPVRKCLNHISRNLHGKITLSALAEHCGLSRDYLSLLFRKSVGCSVSRYVSLSARFFLGEPFHQAFRRGMRHDARKVAAGERALSGERPAATKSAEE